MEVQRVAVGLAALEDVQPPALRRLRGLGRLLVHEDHAAAAMGRKGVVGADSGSCDWPSFQACGPENAKIHAQLSDLLDGVGLGSKGPGQSKIRLHFLVRKLLFVILAIKTSEVTSTWPPSHSCISTHQPATCPQTEQVTHFQTHPFPTPALPAAVAIVCVVSAAASSIAARLQAVAGEVPLLPAIEAGPRRRPVPERAARKTCVTQTHWEEIVLRQQASHCAP